MNSAQEQTISEEDRRKQIEDIIQIGWHADRARIEHQRQIEKKRRNAAQAARKKNRRKK